MSHTPPWLTVFRPDGSTDRHSVDKDEYLIGRQPPADLALPYPQVSRRHARIMRRGWSYWLEDLGSRNGVFVDGEPVDAQPVRLVDGDEIVVAGVVALTFHDPSETVAGPRLGRLEGVWIDPASEDVWVDAVRVSPPLSLSQMRLLRLLYERAGRPASRGDIIAAVWPEENPEGVSKQAVDGLIKRLRSRLREASPEQEYIQVVRGYGLRLVQPLST